MGEVGLIAFLGKWIPILFSVAFSIVAKLIWEKYNTTQKQISKNEEDIEKLRDDLHQMDRRVIRMEGEKIGRPEFERVLSDLKTEVKEEFSEFRKEFKDQMKEDKNDRKQQFDALFDMIRRLENKKD